MAAKLKMPTPIEPSFPDEASTLPHGVFAKQDPPSHSALVPLGHGFAVSQFSTSSSQEAPQKNLDATSSTADVEAVLELVSLPPDGLVSGDRFVSDVSSSVLQGVPLKHCLLPGQSMRFVE
jgi:hypothetical protein